MNIPTLSTLAQSDSNHTLEDHEKQKKAILEDESQKAIGSQILLTEDEKKTNDILMKWKLRSLTESPENPEYFNFSKHYFSYKNDMERSRVYQIIKKMPKGAVLHVHSSMMLPADVLLKFTYEDHLYACFSHGLALNFSLTPPDTPSSSEWALLKELRNNSGDITAFDAKLKSYFTLYRENSEEYNFVDTNTVWKRFEKVNQAIESLLAYRPVREKYIYETLKRCYEDNVMYIEIRIGLDPVYELDGTIHPPEYVAHLYKKVTKKFIKDYPDFVGVKLILTGYRGHDPETVSEAISMAIHLKAEMPELIAGFDLVGQEDLGKPLSEFVPLLTAAKSELDLFLHAGETLWLGTSSDENLVDAVLLGSKRIGHGYALLKHPSLMSAVINNDIALEVNLLSNTILGLVKDVRNHPLSVYIALGLPIVVSSDDPGAWDAEPLSTDFTVAFMGAASKKADLRMLNQLAMNSINYSALDEEGKLKLYNVYRRQWDKFIDELILSDNDVNQ